MIMIGILIGTAALVVFVNLITEYDKSVSGILISFVVVVLGVIMIVYDIESPVEIYITDTFITTKYDNASYSQPVKITTYDRKPTKFLCIAKTNKAYKYDVEILSDEAIEYWENINE